MNDVKIDLPVEVLKHILEFDGRFIFQNNKFRSIIAKNDYRYSILEELTRYWTMELREMVHPYTDKKRWMVVICLSRRKTNKNVPYPCNGDLSIGLTIFSNWRYPGEWTHLWFNNTEPICEDFIYTKNEQKFIRETQMPCVVGDQPINKILDVKKSNRTTFNL